MPANSGKIDSDDLRTRFNERYRTSQAPWDIGRPDFNLIRLVDEKKISPCPTLEVGCGSGDNSLWLAGKGFRVTGIDTSDLAIEKARERVIESGLDCTFTRLDFLVEPVASAPFSFVFDRGCFHTFDSDELRKQYAKNTADHLVKNGLWLSLIGNADERREGPGPPQRRAADIVRAVEPFFKILSLTTSHFESHHPTPPRSWICLLQKRY